MKIVDFRLHNLLIYTVGPFGSTIKVMGVDSWFLPRRTVHSTRVSIRPGIRIRSYEDYHTVDLLLLAKPRNSYVVRNSCLSWRDPTYEHTIRAGALYVFAGYLSFLGFITLIIDQPDCDC